MATTSTIAAKLNGKVGIIYCHFDGYIDNVGSLLFKHYNTETKIEELIRLGNLSSLDHNITKTEAYGRDYHRKNQEAIFSANHKQALKKLDCSHEFTYYHDGKDWYVNGKKLEQALLEE
ncbi:hypothetical protein [Neisseria sp. Ec49-e6-T10]|uniref:hypothetical protein n=1 Tax=Neisseria sp. Ec49-e6-T10 TaxID=3140744 RepID=UPI003EBA3F05